MGMDDLAKLPFHHHAMLLYSSEGDKADIKYVNEALRRGHLTVYLPIDGDNSTSHMSEMASETINYEDNVNHGNLLTLDIKSFYNLALAGNLRPFEELKILLEEAINERVTSKRNDEIILVIGLAGGLAKNQKFDESINAEKWWQKTYSEWLQKGLKVTIICPHFSSILDNSEFMHYRQAISAHHDIVEESSYISDDNGN